MNQLLKRTIFYINNTIDQPHLNNAGYVSELLLFCLTEGISLVDIENEFRETNSRVYLIAMPMKRAEKKQFKSLLPNQSNEMPNYLWVCMNGEEEANETFKKNRLNSNANLEKLKQTGLLNVKQS